MRGCGEGCGEGGARLALPAAQQRGRGAHEGQDAADGDHSKKRNFSSLLENTRKKRHNLSQNANERGSVSPYAEGLYGSAIWIALVVAREFVCAEGVKGCAT